MNSNCDEKDSNEVWYFAYGSNLYVPQMQTRVGQCKKPKKAQLRGWRLVFNVASGRRGGGAANIVRTDKPDDVVYGVVYHLSRQQLDVLTEYEGVSPQDIEVESEGKEIEAKTYVFKQDKPPLKPAPSYIETIVRGLKQHCYGEDVIKAIKKERVS